MEPQSHRPLHQLVGAEFDAHRGACIRNLKVESVFAMHHLFLGLLVVLRLEPRKLKIEEVLGDALKVWATCFRT
jgi:hypothetical protein